MEGPIKYKTIYINHLVRGWGQYLYGCLRQMNISLVQVRKICKISASHERSTPIGRSVMLNLKKKMWCKIVLLPIILKTIVCLRRRNNYNAYPQCEVPFAKSFRNNKTNLRYVTSRLHFDTPRQHSSPYFTECRNVTHYVSMYRNCLSPRTTQHTAVP